MRDGICPKCGQASVHTADTSLASATAQYPVAVAFDRQFLQKSSSTTDYVCVSCGYFERYLTDRKMLDRIAAEWQPVTRTGSVES